MKDWLKRKLENHVVLYSIMAFPFNFNILKYLYSIYLSKKYSYKNLQDFEFKKNIVIVGSGPSLDEVDLGIVKNSTVIFLNGSVARYPEFDKETNNFIWYAQDINGVNRHIEKAHGFGIKKVFTIDNWHSSFVFRHFLDSNDVFLMPRIEFRRAHSSLNDAYGPYSLRVSFLGFGNHEFFHQSLSKKYLHSHTSVIFSAISLCCLMAPKTIVLMGFDSPTKSSDYLYADLTETLSEKATKKLAFSDDVIQYYLVNYHKHLNSERDFLVNFSPKTHEDVLPKIRCLSEYKEFLKVSF